MDFSRMQQQRNVGMNIPRGQGPSTMDMNTMQSQKGDEMNSRMKQMQDQRSFNMPGGGRGGGRPAEIDFSLPM